MTDILIRILESAAIVVAGLAVYAAVSQLVLRRARRKAARLETGRPSIVYFTTPDCIPCKTIQRPAIRALRERLGSQLNVIEVDARKNPEMAREWGVLTVPTTFVIDAEGCPRHVNHGVASAQRLFEQLQNVVETTPG